MTIQWTHIGRTGQRKWKMRGEKRGWGKAVWETGNKVEEKKDREEGFNRRWKIKNKKDAGERTKK